MTKSKTIYFIGLFYLMTALLMIVKNNVPVFASNRFLWSPILLGYALIAFPDVYKSKQTVNVLMYGILYCGILHYTLWSFSNDWYKKAILNDFYYFIASVVLFTILIKYNLLKEWIKLSKAGIVFFIVTGIMTIIATEINPMIIRVSYSGGEEILRGYDAIAKLGFGGYGYMTAVIALLPVIVFFIKQKRKIWLSRRNWIILLLFFIFVLIRAQIFANVLVATSIIFLAFSGSQNFNRNIFFILLIFFIFSLIPDAVWSNLFVDLSRYFTPGSEMNKKFIDFSTFVANKGVIDASTGAGGRAERYPMLFTAFSAQPFLGDASYVSPFSYEMDIGGHLYWMSRLALWGIFGFVGYIIILKNVFKPVYKMFNKEFRYYYLLSLLGIIMMGLMKSLGGREMYIMLLIIIPGLYFLSLANKKQ